MNALLYMREDQQRFEEGSRYHLLIERNRIRIWTTF